MKQLPHSSHIYVLITLLLPWISACNAMGRFKSMTYPRENFSKFPI